MHRKNACLVWKFCVGSYSNDYYIHFWYNSYHVRVVLDVPMLEPYSNITSVISTAWLLWRPSSNMPSQFITDKQWKNMCYNFLWHVLFSAPVTREYFARFVNKYLFTTADASFMCLVSCVYDSENVTWSRVFSVSLSKYGLNENILRQEQNLLLN